MFKVIKKQGRARRGQFQCAHGGVVQTPVFMNVGTQAAIKGGIDAFDLRDQLGCQIELSNTYHLHLRPGDETVKVLGGLHKFMGWDGPILTDSGQPAEDQGGGRDLRLPSGWPPHLHGPGGEHAHPVQSGQRYRHGL